MLETRPELRWPAEMYLEGSDQHRGWFHSSLLESMATRGAPPYRTVLTHGFVVDGEGRKMSKSVGNVISLDDLLPKYGAEVLRLWVAAEDYTEDIRRLVRDPRPAGRRLPADPEHVPLPARQPRRLRRPAATASPTRAWTRSTGSSSTGWPGWSIASPRAYEEYQFHTAFHAVHNFCAVDLSALYLDVIKDRLYTSRRDDPRRRAAQTVCYEVFAALVRLMAPMLTFTAEEAWRYLPGARAESVHLERFPEVPLAWLDDTLKRDWDRLLEVRREVARALELARARKLIGSGLEAPCGSPSAPEDLPALLRAKRTLLPTLFIVSRVELGPGPPGAVHYESQEIPGLVIDVDRAPGDKCERCWMRSPAVGASPAHPGLCDRCVAVVGA